MVNARVVEIWVGLFIAGGIAALFVLAMKVSNISSFSKVEGYELTARFENVGGLKKTAPVTIAGVRIGRVGEINFDDTTYEAIVHLNIDKKFDKLPTDTTAGIFTAGLLGEQYVSLEAGGEENYMKDQDEIKITQSALVLEQVIGQFLFSKASEGGNGGNN
ncbi:MAG: outer membrane lipid asymmetry maintenance protein MlaD [Gammaproteobacteria bacterium]|nr:outer membrane lipid asymmetry maintenance protein MlaD [Gammaproteobacteria bacterium]